MSRARYFRDELSFLKEQGREFCEVHPQLSRFLDSKNTDPDIERLLEGFAFLTGRLREKVEDEFPELTHSIINMLWPNYLRPLPSMTIMQFAPSQKQSITEKQTVKKGVQVAANQAIEGTLVHFTTCRAVDILPLKKVAAHASHSRDTSVIELQFNVLVERPIEDLNIQNLRFFLNADPYSSQMLYLWLSHYLQSIEVVFDDDSLAPIRLPKDCLRHVGFSADDGILPYPKNVYEGYRIIQEFLVYPEAFHFFELVGLAQLKSGHYVPSFKLHMTFSKTLPADVKVNNDAFELYCTPAINLFSHDADPVNLDGKSTEYKIRPSGRHSTHYEVFNVEKVQGWLASGNGRSRGESRVYAPFESFQHDIERSQDRRSLYYRSRVKDSIRGDGFDHFMSFIRSDESLNVSLTEAVSIDLICTNRNLPLALGRGDIASKTDSTPAFATFSNITEPSAPLRPALDGSLLWTLISNLSLNYLSLLSKDALCSVLRAYDFRALADRQAERIANQRLKGILDIQTSPIEKIFKGLPVRGLKSTISLQADCFHSEGDLYLFGTVLSHFFALYATIKSFHELVIINDQNTDEYRWKNRTGLQPLI
jgi:type VI secretion system protein ImpG